MTLSYVALGTNLGDRLLNLAEARRRLGLLGPLRAGPVLETDALLPPGDRAPQPRYLNTVVELSTSLGARALFAALKRIEREMGRVETTRWAPRVIDLDLVLHGAEVVEEPSLVVPHPGLALRRFVLEPLVVLAPGAWHPGLHATSAELLDRLMYGSPARRLSGQGGGKGTHAVPLTHSPTTSRRGGPGHQPSASGGPGGSRPARKHH
jgi:2-amino-4-hydroxy-6-hydroxymethyldihydropteridine diphosphokinase